jgi:DNA-binding IscR family transcriptional regulator
VRDGILKGIRGPRGGNELGREQRRICAEDILRSAGRAEDIDERPLSSSNTIIDLVRNALVEAERAFSAALARINIEDMVAKADRRK